jgi:hypothetical protein
VGVVREVRQYNLRRIHPRRNDDVTSKNDKSSMLLNWQMSRIFFILLYSDPVLEDFVYRFHWGLCFTSKLASDQEVAARPHDILMIVIGDKNT